MPRSEVWGQLRLTRSRPPADAAEGAGANLYRAALQQFEDLMLAAEAMGPAACPLPLFYAISQAGQAIEACHGAKPPRGHGISLRAGGDDVLHSRVQAGKRAGRFQSVSQCVGSPTFQGSIELGALVASLPELAIHMSSDSPWLRAIQIVPDEIVEVDGRARSWASVLPPPWHPCDIRLYEEVRTISELKAVLGRYQEAKDQWIGGGADSSVHSWPADEGVWALSLQWNFRRLPILPDMDFREQLWLRPSVVNGEPPLSRLMTWWLVTFTLSMLARYHPEAWVAALDVNQSPIAVLLERVMSQATETVPQHVFEVVMYAG